MGKALIYALTLLFALVTISLCEENHPPLGFERVTDWQKHIKDRGNQCTKLSEWTEWINNGGGFRDDSNDEGAVGDYQVKLRAGYHTSGVIDTVIDHINTIYPPEKNQKDNKAVIKNDLHFVIHKPEGADNDYAADVYVTYYVQSAGYRNRLSFYRKLEDDEDCGSFDPGQCDSDLGVVKYVAFHVINNNGNDCFLPGMTVTRKLKPGTYGFLLEAQYFNPGEATRRDFYSDWSLSRRPEKMIPVDNLGHATSTRLQFEDDGGNPFTFQLLGFEDQTHIEKGDYDYNDVMFSVFVDGDHEYSETPIYDEDVIKECRDLRNVPQYSYSEGVCDEGSRYAYGYLELPGYRENSINFLKPTNGWKYFPFDSEDFDLITLFRDNPEYHGKCIGYVNGNELVRRVYNAGEFTPCSPDGEFWKYECNDDDEDCRSYEGDVPCYNVKHANDKILIRKEVECREKICQENTHYQERYPATSDSSIVSPMEVDIVFNGEIDTTTSFDFHIKSNSALDTNSDDSIDIVYVLYNPSAQTLVRFDPSAYQIEDTGYITRTAVYSYDSGKLTQLKSFYQSNDATGVIEDIRVGSGQFKVSDLKEIAGNNYGWDQGSFKIVNIIHGFESYESINDEDLSGLYSNGAFINMVPTRGLNLPANLKENHISTTTLPNMLNSIKKAEGEGCVIVTGNVSLLEDDSETSRSRCGLRNKENLSVKATEDSNGSVIYAIGRGKLTITSSINQEPVYGGGVENINFYYEGSTTQAIDLNDFWSDPNGDDLTFKIVNTDIQDFYDISITSGIVTIKFLGPEPPSQSFTFSYEVTDGCYIGSKNVNVHFVCGNNADCVGLKCEDIDVQIDKTDPFVFWEEIDKVVEITNNPESKDFEWTYEVRQIIGDINTHMVENLEVGSLIENPSSGKNHTFIYGTYEMNENSFRVRYEAIARSQKTPKVYETDDLRIQCNVRLFVNPQLNPPIVNNGEERTREDENLFFNIDESYVDTYEEYLGGEPNRRLMLAYHQETDNYGGELQCCFAKGTDGANCVSCKDELTEPHFVEQIIFKPAENDYGDCDVLSTDISSDCLYKTVTFKAYDAVHVSRGLNFYNLLSVDIHVVPVNDEPTIEVTDVTNGSEDETNADIYILEQEDEVSYVTFRVRDIDTLPESITSFVRIRRYSGEVEMHACRTEDESSCDIRIGSGDEIQPFHLETTDCPDQATLKEAHGTVLENCYADFMYKFRPLSYSPNNRLYATLTKEGYDSFDRSEPALISYIVTPRNAPPTVVSPDVIEVATKSFRVVLDEEYVTIWDDANPNHHKDVSIEMRILEGKGKFIPHDSSIEGWECNLETGEDETETLICASTDYNSINIWLRELKFEMDEDDDEVVVEFKVNDGGYPNSDLEAKYSEATTTTFIYEEVVSIPPVKNNSTLTIVAASVGAAAAVALGLLVFFLRNAIKPPADDYFNTGAATVSGTPTNPIYSPQTVENVSPYYRGA